MEQQKPIPTLIYGLVGVAAVGAISLALLAIIVLGMPAPDQFALSPN
jgi:hypothetical protein